MSETESKIQKIIRLKRYEKPREGYFDDFLEEFQERREREMTENPPATSTFGRLSAWFRGMNSGKWVMGAGVAYAGLIVIVFTWPKDPEARPDPSRQPVIFEPKSPPKNPVIPPKAEKPEVGP